MAVKSAVAACAGMAVVHLASICLYAPAFSAAWAWYLDVPSDASFTCEEGTTRGCPGMGYPGYEECGNLNFTCTVKAKSGYTCQNPSEIYVVCANDANPTATFQPKSGGACINVGFGDLVLDSTLKWSDTPSCSAATDGSVDSISTTTTALATTMSQTTQQASAAVTLRMSANIVILALAAHYATINREMVAW